MSETDTSERTFETTSRPTSPVQSVDAPTRGDGPVLVGIFGLVMVILIFLGDAGPRVLAPFGPGAEGSTAATWAIGARSLVESGPIESRFGARSPELGVYAHHPPALIAPVAVTQLPGSDEAWLARLPAVAASIGALILLRRLLLRLGASQTAALTAPILMAGTQMFLQFGIMLATETTSLIVAIALLVVWNDGRRPRLIGLVAFVAAIFSYRTLALAGLLLGFEVLRTLWGARRAGLVPWHGAGLLAGMAVTATWLRWANGSFDAVIGAAERRSTGAEFTSDEFLSLQWTTILFTIPPWLIVLGPIFLVAGLVSTRTRIATGSSLVVTLAFAALFPQGASAHIYWNYWALLPLAIGAAAMVDLLGLGVKREGVAGMTRVAVLGLSFVALIATTLDHSDPEHLFRIAQNAGELLETASIPEDQEVIWIVNGEEWPTWASYYSRRPFRQIWDSDLLAEVVSEHGQDQVLVPFEGSWEPAEIQNIVRARALADSGRYALVRASDLSDLVSVQGDG